jgi:TonB family protein
MNAAVIENFTWSRRRICFLIALVFAGQVALIFWLSDYSIPRPKSRARPLALHLPANVDSELVALQDPTLFALPHQRGFSGLAWLAVPVQKLPSSDVATQPRWLPLAVEQMGEVFTRVFKTNRFDTPQSLADASAELILPKVAPLTLSAEGSVLRIEGALAQRQLLTPLALPSQITPEILTNTVIQMVVDEAGQLVAASLLLPGSGSKQADQEALTLARKAQFNSIEERGPQRVPAKPPGRLTWGTMVFQWHTRAGTNVVEVR